MKKKQNKNVEGKNPLVTFLFLDNAIMQLRIILHKRKTVSRNFIDNHRLLKRNVCTYETDANIFMIPKNVNKTN